VPVTWEIRDKMVVIAVEGVYPNQELEDALTAALSDPRFEPGMAVLMDARLSQTPLSSEDIEWRASLIESLPARGLQPRVAYLIQERQRALSELARQEFRSPKAIYTVDIGFFTDESEAKAWLESPPGRAGR
jgi:cellulase/cellobiase CelA1